MLSREKAKSICLKHQSVNITNEVIDEIFDDFESRTCENCKHNLKNSGKPKGCKVIEISPLDMRKDFGCNKWESKDKK